MKCCFEKLVDYNEMKVFECLAFSTTPDHKNDTLQPRGGLCIFLGYHPTQKGVRLDEFDQQRDIHI